MADETPPDGDETDEESGDASSDSAGSNPETADPSSDGTADAAGSTLGGPGPGGRTDPDRPGPDPPGRPGPSVDVPTAPDLPAGDEVPADVQRAFWTLVLVVKVGLLAVALGAMLAFFRGDWRGGVLVAGGAVLVVRAFQRARAFEHDGPPSGGG